jgi:pimeloyl-ACP methyl ester carboxylesterase
MITGEFDMIPKLDNIQDFVPNIDEVSLQCGHWIQQELPEETNKAILNWLGH